MQKGLLPLFILLFCLSACAPSSGILAGGSWQSSGLQHQHVQTLAIDPNNLQKIYAGDTQGNIFVSTDGAQHWTQHSIGNPLPNPICALSFDDTGKSLYAATEHGLFVSRDGAQHWSAVGKTGDGLPTDSDTALAFDLKALHTIYVGTAHHGVFRSTNDGDTWASGHGLPLDGAINNLTFDTDRHQLWAATSSGVYRSDDGGAIWKEYNQGLPAQIEINTVQVASASGGVPGLLFAGTNHGFFRSQDFGAHWAASQESLARTSVHAILVDFRTPTTVYIGTGVGVLRSNDSGQNWSGIASGLPRDQAVYALAFGSTDYSQLYATTNDVYLFPGSSGGLSITRLVPLIIFGLLFYLVYRIFQRNRRMLKPERIIEPSSPVQRDGKETIYPNE